MNIILKDITVRYTFQKSMLFYSIHHRWKKKQAFNIRKHLAIILEIQMVKKLLYAGMKTWLKHLSKILHITWATEPFKMTLLLFLDLSLDQWLSNILSVMPPKNTFYISSQSIHLHLKPTFNEINTEYVEYLITYNTPCSISFYFLKTCWLGPTNLTL